MIKKHRNWVVQFVEFNSLIVRSFHIDSFARSVVDFVMYQTNLEKLLWNRSILRSLLSWSISILNINTISPIWSEEIELSYLERPGNHGRSGWQKDHRRRREVELAAENRWQAAEEDSFERLGKFHIHKGVVADLDSNPYLVHSWFFFVEMMFEEILGF